MKKSIIKLVVGVIGSVVTAIFIVIGGFNDLVQFFEFINPYITTIFVFIKQHWILIVHIILFILICLVHAILFRIRLFHDKREMSAGNTKLHKFTKRLIKGKGGIGGTPPYISSEMERYMATTIDSEPVKYNAETMKSCGMDHTIYEAILAQKIARNNAVNNCQSAFTLLEELTDSWTVFLNSNGQIVSYWVYIALKDESFEKIKIGTVNEKDICISDARYIDVGGHYKGYLLMSGAVQALRTQKVTYNLYDSWLQHIEMLAKKHIFFDEIVSMVGSIAGDSSLSAIGMTYYADYKFGGKMYKYEMHDIEHISYLKNNYPCLFNLYSEEYKTDTQQTVPPTQKNNEL